MWKDGKAGYGIPVVHRSASGGVAAGAAVNRWVTDFRSLRRRELAKLLPVYEMFNDSARTLALEVP